MNTELQNELAKIDALSVEIKALDYKKQKLDAKMSDLVKPLMRFFPWPVGSIVISPELTIMRIDQICEPFRNSMNGEIYFSANVSMPDGFYTWASGLNRSFAVQSIEKFQVVPPLTAKPAP